ncbi:MAG: small, acid-soluble spore protein, alpha/beta type [Firmicutes bacterium]|nr:small, acid-soluble spore protein, alpha/beta type [Bacillota bacterium]
MSKSSKKAKPPSARDLMKMEIAAELGLAEKVKELGWAGLSAQEAGIIGGKMSQRLRQQGRANSNTRKQG